MFFNFSFYTGRSEVHWEEHLRYVLLKQKQCRLSFIFGIFVREIKLFFFLVSRTSGAEIKSRFPSK